VSSGDSATGWEALKRAIDTARSELMAAAPDAASAAEAEAYLMRLMTAALDDAFLGHLRSERGLTRALPTRGAPNPDYIMWHAAVDSTRTYRLEGWLHDSERVGVGPSPVPLVLTHGWPWTFWDYVEVIDPAGIEVKRTFSTMSYCQRVNNSSSAAMISSPSSFSDSTNSPRFSLATETISSGCRTTDCPLIRKVGLNRGFAIFPSDDLLTSGTTTRRR
jgi:hypothetical protein